MIRCIQSYTSAGTAWNVGDVVNDPELAAWLIRDSAASWEIVSDPDIPEIIRSIEDAPNRMVTRETPGTRRRTTRKKAD